MLPANQLDALPEAEHLRTRGIVYAYRNGCGVLITFRRPPEEVQRDMVRSAERALAPAVAANA